MPYNNCMYVFLKSPVEHKTPKYFSRNNILQPKGTIIDIFFLILFLKNNKHKIRL
jgi:hypothetical protein